MRKFIAALLDRFTSRGIGNGGEREGERSLDRQTICTVKETVSDDPATIPAGALDNVALGTHLSGNIEAIESLCGKSVDLIIRRFEIASGHPAALVFYDTLGSSELVANEVIQPLSYDARETIVDGSISISALERVIRTKAISSAQLGSATMLSKVAQGLVEGKVALLLDGFATAIMVNLVGYERRSIQEPASEPVVRGPREGFTESLHTNISLIRRRIGTPLLRFESRKVGRWTQTDVAIAYIHGLAGRTLVDEVRRRLDVIDVDGIFETSYLEEYIEDTPYTVFPQILSTERPDVVAANLLEGRVAILCNGTPFALLVPTTLWSLMNASEDHYQRWDGANFIRFLRFGLVSLVVLLPSLYVAATTFHPEMLPGTMLLSIAAAREAVPFSSFTEVFAMELTFEALREAGVRLPRPVGQTIGIVGAIVISEAAVQAQLVSAPVVIIVAFTGISSFVIPHFNLGVSVRLVRFPLLILAGSFGLFGIAMGVLFLTLHLTTLRSYGVPYLTPVSPLRLGELRDAILRVPRWRMFRRPRLPGTRPTWRQGFPLMPHTDGSESGEASRNAAKQS